MKQLFILYNQQDLPHHIKLLWKQKHAIKRFKEESKILSQ